MAEHTPDLPRRVDLTPAAAELLRELAGIHGPLMFHQSGGCCDGSAPMCYPAGEFLIGDADVHLGDLDIDADNKADIGADAVGGPQPGPFPPVPFYMSRGQFEYWAHTHLTVDVVPGRGAGFSVEAPTGKRFLIRSRLFTDAEALALDATRPQG